MGMEDVRPTTGALFAGLAARRPREAAHSRRVSAYAVRLASQYGVSAQVLDTIAAGALLHDVGKLLVPRRILRKPARLTDREWRQLKRHPVLGFELIGRLDVDPAVREIVLRHHEHYDGSGYPDGLPSREIAWMARIVSVMDSFDALTSPREYRRALSVEGARALIAREAGSRFCPWVVAGLLSLPPHLLRPPTLAGPVGYFPDAPVLADAALGSERWQPWQVPAGGFLPPAIMTA